VWQALSGSKVKQAKYKQGYYQDLLARAQQDRTNAIAEVEKVFLFRVVGLDTPLL
jgi:hypothetical protein